MSPEQVGVEVLVAEGARKMLDALVGLGVVQINHDLNAIVPGRPVGLERLYREMTERGIRR